MTSAFLALQQNCVGASTGKPYIKSISGGKDHSPEGMQVRPSSLL